MSSYQQPSSPARSLERLTRFGWTGSLAIILATLTASFFLLGYFAIYWRSADMDLMVVYNAIVMNDGKPQLYFDHPSYFTILSVKVWFQLLHSVGLLDAYSLPAFLAAPDDPAFSEVMTEAVRAGRLMAWMTATASILVFAMLARIILRDWRIALLATCAFAFSGSMALHIRVMRSEVIAATLVVAALMVLIIAARRASLWRPLMVGAAALLCVLAMENKVQAIILAAAWPVTVLLFGSQDSRSLPFWRSGPAWLVVALAGLLAAGAAMLAYPLVVTGLAPANAVAHGLKPLIAGTFGVYQAALVALVAVCVIAFAAIWRVSLAETVASALLLIAGVAVGLLAMNVVYNEGNVVAVLNPLEKMLMYAGFDESGGERGLKSMIEALGPNIVGVLKRYTYVLRTSPRPAVFLIWLIIPAIVYVWRRGQRQTALQASLLLLIAFGFDVVGNQRGLGLPIFYTTFSDPLIILAGALLLVQIPNIWTARFALPISILLIAVHVGFSQAEPIKRIMSRATPESVCDWEHAYMPLLQMPWCKAAPAKQ